MARWLDTGDVFNRTTEAILENALCPRFAGQPVIEGKLQAFLAAVIDIREAQQMTGHLGSRVVAAILPLHVDAGDVLGKHVSRHFRGQTTLHVHEALVHIARTATRQRVGIDSEQPRQRRYTIDGRRDLPGISPDAIDRRTDRERLTVAIGDCAAVRDDPFVAQMPRIGLPIEEFLVEHLQVHRARNKRAGDAGEQHDNNRAAAGESVRRLLLGFCAASH